MLLDEKQIEPSHNRPSGSLSYLDFSVVSLVVLVHVPVSVSGPPTPWLSSPGPHVLNPSSVALQNVTAWRLLSGACLTVWAV